MPGHDVVRYVAVLLNESLVDGCDLARAQVLAITSE